MSEYKNPFGKFVASLRFPREKSRSNIYWLEMPNGTVTDCVTRESGIRHVTYRPVSVVDVASNCKQNTCNSIVKKLINFFTQRCADSEEAYWNTNLISIEANEVNVLTLKAKITFRDNTEIIIKEALVDDLKTVCIIINRKIAFAPPAHVANLLRESLLRRKPGVYGTGLQGFRYMVDFLKAMEKQPTHRIPDILKGTITGTVLRERYGLNMSRKLSYHFTEEMSKAFDIVQDGGPAIEENIEGKKKSSPTLAIMPRSWHAELPDLSSYFGMAVNKDDYILHEGNEAHLLNAIDCFSKVAMDELTNSLFVGVDEANRACRVDSRISRYGYLLFRFVSVGFVMRVNDKTRVDMESTVIFCSFDKGRTWLGVEHHVSFCSDDDGNVYPSQGENSWSRIRDMSLESKVRIPVIYFDHDKDIKNPEYLQQLCEARNIVLDNEDYDNGYVEGEPEEEVLLEEGLHFPEPEPAEDVNYALELVESMEEDEHLCEEETQAVDDEK